MLENQDSTALAHLQAERMVTELSRQQGFIVEETGSAFAVFPAEFIDDGMLARLRAYDNGRLSLLLTGARAISLGIGQEQGQATCIDASTLSHAQLLALADPLAPVATSAAQITPASEAQCLALLLSKQAGLLPALLLAQLPAGVRPAGWYAITLAQLRLYHHHPLLELLPGISAQLPIKQAQQVRLSGFRNRYGTSVHLALTIGEPARMDAPLVRVHSSCITGDILGSLRCDCGGQLALALELLSAEGGVLLYLQQEGRGIGILNKLRAYQLQERGIDTYEANLLLGYGEDERNFAIAGAILRQLGITRLRLLTNNPHKLAALQAHGVTIAERVPLVTDTTAHNRDYIHAKIHKSGHFF